VAATTAIAIANNPVSQICCPAHFRLIANKGNSRTGRKIRPEAAPGSVSVKTMVIR
jgi:hypothetical protein